jgi:hypothetical protein
MTSLESWVSRVTSSALSADEVLWLVRVGDAVHSSVDAQGCVEALRCAPVLVATDELGRGCSACSWEEVGVTWKGGLVEEVVRASNLLATTAVCQRVSEAPSLEEVEAFAWTAHAVLREFPSTEDLTRTAWERSVRAMSGPLLEEYLARSGHAPGPLVLVRTQATWRVKDRMLKLALAGGALERRTAILRAGVVKVVERYAGDAGWDLFTAKVALEREPSEAELEALAVLTHGGLSLREVWEAAKAL